MQISLIQFDIRRHDADDNIRRVVEMMDSAPGSDVYVLPEMWVTGFETDPKPEVNGMGQKALACMLDEARRRDCAIVGSLAVCDAPDPSGTGAVWHNRCYFVTPEGVAGQYDKRHLFAYGGEDRAYEAGSAPCVVSWRGVRWMLQVCFDLRFPESARNRANGGYDVVVYVASWPASRRNAWEALLTARAIENQACCIGVNRTGTDGDCPYAGGSRAIDAYGHPLCVADDRPGIYTFTPDFNRQRHLREKFPVLP